MYFFFPECNFPSRRVFFALEAYFSIPTRFERSKAVTTEEAAKFLVTGANDAANNAAIFESQFQHSDVCG